MQYIPSMEKCEHLTASEFDTFCWKCMKAPFPKFVFVMAFAIALWFAYYSSLEQKQTIPVALGSLVVVVVATVLRRHPAMLALALAIIIPVLAVYLLEFPGFPGVSSVSPYILGALLLLVAAPISYAIWRGWVHANKFLEDYESSGASILVVATLVLVAVRSAYYGAGALLDANPDHYIARAVFGAQSRDRSNSWVKHVHDGLEVVVNLQWAVGALALAAAIFIAVGAAFRRENQLKRTVSAENAHALQAILAAIMIVFEYAQRVMAAVLRGLYNLFRTTFIRYALLVGGLIRYSLAAAGVAVFAVSADKLAVLADRVWGSSAFVAVPLTDYGLVLLGSLVVVIAVFAIIALLRSPLTWIPNRNLARRSFVASGICSSESGILDTSEACRLESGGSDSWPLCPCGYSGSAYSP